MVKAISYFNQNDTQPQNYLEAQREKARELAANKGWQISREIVEQGMISDMTIEERADLWEMLRGAQGKSFMVLIIPSICNLAWQQSDRAKIVRRLSQLGICIQLLDRSEPLVPAYCDLEAMAEALYANAMDGSIPSDIVLENTLDPVRCEPDGVIDIYGEYID